MPASDEKRKTGRLTELPPEETISDDGDRDEAKLAQSLDEADYRDDVLRLLFVCCHPDLQPNAADRTGAEDRFGHVGSSGSHGPS